MAVTTTQTRLTADGNAEEREFVRLFDASTFTELDSLELEPYELALSVCPVDLDGGHRFLAVGTGYALPGEDEPTRGRVLLASVSKNVASSKGSGAAMEEEGEGEGAGAEDEGEEGSGGEADAPEPRQLSVVTEYNAQGGCYAVRCMEGKLLVCCNTEVMTMALEGGDSPSLKVLHKCGGHVSCIFMSVVGRHVLVGDVMRAISVLKMNDVGDGLEEVERDFRTAWTSAIGFIAPGAYLSADMDGNLVCSTTNTAALNDDDRVRLNIAGEYHLGSIVNSIVLGTLSQQPGADQPSETAATAATMATTDASGSAAAATAGAGAGADAENSSQSQTQVGQQGDRPPRGQEEEFRVPGMPGPWLRFLPCDGRTPPPIPRFLMRTPFPTVVRSSVGIYAGLPLRRHRRICGSYFLRHARAVCDAAAPPARHAHGTWPGTPRFHGMYAHGIAHWMRVSGAGRAWRRGVRPSGLALLQGHHGKRLFGGARLQPRH